MIIELVEIHDRNKNAESIDDFYYRDYKEDLEKRGKTGTGIRGLAQDMIERGSIVNRYVYLKSPHRLVTVTMFLNKQAYDEWRSDERFNYVKRLWVEKKWDVRIDVIEPVELLDVANCKKY